MRLARTTALDRLQFNQENSESHPADAGRIRTQRFELTNLVGSNPTICPQMYAKLGWHLTQNQALTTHSSSTRADPSRVGHVTDSIMIFARTQRHRAYKHLESG